MKISREAQNTACYTLGSRMIMFSLGALALSTHFVEAGAWLLVQFCQEQEICGRMMNGVAPFAFVPEWHHR